MTLGKIRPAVKIILDRERHLTLDLNAMVLFEEKTGLSLFGLDTGKLRASELRALIWACLVHEDTNLTIEQVGARITLDNMAEMTTGPTGGFNRALPEKPAEAGATGKTPL